MPVRFFSLAILSLLFLSGSSSAQTASTEPTAEKDKAKTELEKRVIGTLDQVIADASLLRLPRNRAVLYSLAGDLYWKYDEKRSLDLFRRAGADLLASTADSEREKAESDDPFTSMWDWDDVRQEVLPLIAKRDPELALDLLIQTRPQKVAEAIAKYTAPAPKDDKGESYSPERFRYQREIALEQQFALLVAENDPDKAIKLIKESLAKGISYNVLTLLHKLNQKSDKKASEFAGEVIKKIVESDLAKRKDDLNAALQFLQFATNPNTGNRPPDQKPFKFSETQVADLANKLANTFLQPSASMEMTFALSRAMSSFEKVIPERVPILRQKLNDSNSKLPVEMKRQQERQKVWDQNSTPEEILAMWPKLGEMEKVSAQQSLLYKIRDIEDETRAKKLIEQIPDPKTRERVQEEYEAARIGRQARAGKLDEARRSIANLTKKKTQIQRLVALAIDFHKKGSETDIETANSLMKDAKGLANEFPEDEDDLADLMEVVRGFSVVDPPEAFRLFNPVIDQVNDVVQASAVLSKYNKRNRSFQKGELVMRTRSWSSDGVFFFRFANVIESLGKADIDKMSSTADRLQRPDSRSIIKLFLIQGFQRDEKKANSNDPASGGAIYYSF